MNVCVFETMHPKEDKETMSFCHQLTVSFTAVHVWGGRLETVTVVRSFLPSTRPCLEAQPQSSHVTKRLPWTQLRPHTFPYVLRTMTTWRRNCMRRGQIIVEDGPRSLPRVGSLAFPTSLDARCCTFENTCTRTTRDTRLFCVNAQLRPNLGLTKSSFRIATSGDWGHLSTTLDPPASTHSNHARPSRPTRRLS